MIGVQYLVLCESVVQYCTSSNALCVFVVPSKSVIMVVLFESVVQRSTVLQLPPVRSIVRHRLVLLNTGQFGSVPNHTSLEPILLTQLTNDNCRLLRCNLARFDNDTSACFYRIIVPLAMLAARWCGMSDESVRIHAETLENMKYSIKTQYGVSVDSYSGTKGEPLFGTGQGSGASPAAWLT